MEKMAHWWEPLVEKNYKLEKEQKGLMKEIILSKQISIELKQSTVELKQSTVELKHATVELKHAVCDLRNKFNLVLQFIIKYSDDKEKAIFKSLGLL